MHEWCPIVVIWAQYVDMLALQYSFSFFGSKAKDVLALDLCNVLRRIAMVREHGSILFVLSTSEINYIPGAIDKTDADSFVAISRLIGYSVWPLANNTPMLFLDTVS